MRIIVINTCVFPVGKTGTQGYSGLEHLAWLQAKGLAEKGHKVTLIAAEGSECPRVEVLHVNKAGSWDEKDSYNRYWQRLVECNDGGCIIDNTWNKYSYILKMEGRLHCPVLGVLHAPVNTMYQSLPPVDKPCFVCISQDQRQQTRKQGKYAPMIACPCCGKRKSLLPAYPKQDGGQVRDDSKFVGLFICASCIKRESK